ncbi:MAG: hypothetical protein ABI813_10660 [Bacteroidota bacterium]
MGGTGNQKNETADAWIPQGENIEHDNPEIADVVLVWITSGAKSLFESDGSPLYLSLGVDYINDLSAKNQSSWR